MAAINTVSFWIQTRATTRASRSGHNTDCSPTIYAICLAEIGADGANPNTRPIMTQLN